MDEMMAEQEELLKEAQKYYHTEGGQLEAIQLYKKLLEKYPDNMDGWSGLSTMQYDIQDFDNAIRSCRTLLSLDPDNVRNVEMFLTQLSLLKTFTFAAPDMYLNEQTREAYEIKELTGQFALCEQIEKYSHQLIALYKDNLKKVYRINFNLALTLITYGKFQAGIDSLEKAIKLKEYGDRILNDPLVSIYNWMSTAYIGLEDYQSALNYIELAFENGLDEYSYLKKADIYRKLGDLKMHDQIIEEFIIIIDKKITTSPETAYINQKIHALVQLGDFDRAELALSEFEVFKPYHEQTIKMIEKNRAFINDKKGLQ